MLQKNNRLKKIRDFNLLMKRGLWQRSAFLDLKYLELAQNQNYFPKKEDKDTFKEQLLVAFGVGLKVSKRAVERNGIKRKLSEIVRLLIKEEKIKSGYYLLFAAKKGILEKNYKEMEEEIKSLLKKAGILL